jgi:hypothetical protein
MVNKHDIRRQISFRSVYSLYIDILNCLRKPTINLRDRNFLLLELTASPYEKNREEKIALLTIFSNLIDLMNGGINFVDLIMDSKFKIPCIELIIKL